jgi:diguanylate cyclase (GGDEF)-like protein/PAS domain S-box-containing protein
MNMTDNIVRLLLVDDDVVLRSVAGRTLGRAGFEMTVADSGEEALRLFEDADFDLVLLDVMMPGIDGFEVCSRIRSTVRGAMLPILMLTGLNDTESIDAAFRCGATDFVTKPINWTLLGHRVRYSLRASAAAEAAVRNSEQLAAAQRLARMGSWDWSPVTGEVTCSHELLRLLGRQDQPAKDVTMQWLLDHVCEEDRNAVRLARATVANGDEPYQLNFSIERADGQRRVFYEQTRAWRDAADKVTKVTAIAQDITDRIEAERRIHRLAFHDDLTGLPNRQFLKETATAAIERSRRLHGSCAVLHVDLDRFKQVNDVLGHGGGDALLCNVAARLQAFVRRSDITSVGRAGTTPDVLARVGGNAFTVLLVDLASEKQAALVCARLLQAISQPVALGGREFVVTASAGIALFPRDADDVHGLVQRAEQAMYAAKAAGRGQQCFYDQEANRAASVRVALEQDLRRAIAADELCLFFQPKVHAGHGAMFGAEALVRWRHPLQGLLPPGDFIPLAEESGLIVTLDDWVLHAACKALRSWSRAGVDDIRLSINLSSASFMQDDLVDRLDAAVQHYGVDSRRLTLEITESLLMADLDRAVARLHVLRGKGFGLSLDDFGTGFSSLSYLKRFPIDELKIDRSFVRDVAKGGRDAAIAGSIIALGRQFGLNVVAEGVETEAQSALLLDLGCPLQQGFLFARPLPADEFEMLLARGPTACALLVGCD